MYVADNSYYQRGTSFGFANLQNGLKGREYHMEYGKRTGLVWLCIVGFFIVVFSEPRIVRAESIQVAMENHSRGDGRRIIRFR